MRLLVTGGLGFIGANLAAALADRPDVDLRILDNGSAGRARGPLLDKRIEIRHGDILDGSAVAAAAAGADAIVHLAAATGVVESVRAPREHLRVNVDGTVILLEAARAAGVRRFVFASSNAAVGAQPPPLDEAMAARPVSPYGAGKLAGEALCTAWARAFGLETVSLRFSNVYGPHAEHKASVVAAFLGRARRGGPLQVHGDGSQTRDFLYVEDLCEAIRLALERGRPGTVLHIGSGQETPIAALAKRVSRLVEADLGIEVPIGVAPARPGDVPRNCASIARARAELGYAPRVGLDEGLERTWAWLRALPDRAPGGEEGGGGGTE